uniref:Uncharacterized protein n=1 Tax=Octopus bimaculoides TaxID=37653 RepID=A0A0L8HKP9_OCTBM
MHISSSTKGHAQLVKVKQLTSKSVVSSRIFAVAHLFIIIIISNIIIIIITTTATTSTVMTTSYTAAVSVLVLV